MRLHGLGNLSTIAALLAGLVGGSENNALAQNNASVAAEGELAVTTKAALTSEEQVAQADAIVRRGNQLAERLSRMLDESRRDKDILRANCVNRKLTEVNANVRNVEQRAKALKDASQGADEGRRNHEFTVLTVLGAKLDTLSQEAEQCLGESVYEPGESQVVTTIPNNVLVGIDPSTVPSTPPPPPAVNVPPDMSGMN